MTEAVHTRDCEHCGQAIWPETKTFPLCHNCAKPENLRAWEEDHAVPEPEEAPAEESAEKPVRRTRKAQD